MKFLKRPPGTEIAYRKIDGRGPGVVWLGGLRSDMDGTKAQYLADWAARQGRAFIRFDYSGHGSSSGRFEDGSIAAWRDDALAVLDELTEGPQILVGSSMGGWMGMLLAHARPERLAGMVLIAPAPDFTDVLMWDLMPEEIRRIIEEKGVWQFENGEESYPITKALIDGGRVCRVLDKNLVAGVAVRILHGMADRDVPWSHGAKLMDVIEGDVRFTLVKGSDHRMSSPADLRLIEETLQALLKETP